MAAPSPIAVTLHHPADCPYCLGGGYCKELDAPCHDCGGEGEVCNLCRKKRGECECAGGKAPTCATCKKYLYVCRCGMGNHPGGGGLLAK